MATPKALRPATLLIVTADRSLAGRSTWSPQSNLRDKKYLSPTGPRQSAASTAMTLLRADVCALSRNTRGSVAAAAIFRPGQPKPRTAPWSRRGKEIRAVTNGRGAAASNSASVGRESAETLKSEVLRRIADQRKGGSKVAVLEAVEKLEEQGGGVTASVSGRWTLVYSTRVAEKEAQKNNEVLQQATDTLYKFFFRFAPALAGSQETGATNTSNEQIVDLEAKVVDNIVQIDLGKQIGKRARIRVWGSVESIPGQQSSLQVTFTGWSIALADDGGESLLLKLPLPKPVGLLENTFCDANMRISRGGRGGMFVTRRISD